MFRRKWFRFYRIFMTENAFLKCPAFDQNNYCQLDKCQSALGQAFVISHMFECFDVQTKLVNVKPEVLTMLQHAPLLHNNQTFYYVTSFFNTVMDFVFKWCL